MLTFCCKPLLVFQRTRLYCSILWGFKMFQISQNIKILQPMQPFYYIFLIGQLLSFFKFSDQVNQHSDQLGEVEDFDHGMLRLRYGFQCQFIKMIKVVQMLSALLPSTTWCLYYSLSLSRLHHGAYFSHSFALCVWFEKHPEINSPFLNCNLWHDASRLWCTVLPATSLAGLGRSRAAAYWCCCGTRSFEFLWVDINWPSGQALKRPCPYWLIHLHLTSSFWSCVMLAVLCLSRHSQRTGEASQAHKIEQLAHLAKLLQMQQQMDVKMEKMLTLGNLCPRCRKYMQVCARSGYNPYVEKCWKYVGWIIHQPIRVSNTVPCDWPHSFVQFKTSETGLRHGPQQLWGIALITEWKRRLPSSKAKSAKSTRRTNDFNKSCCRMKGVLHQFRMKALRQKKCKLSKERFGCLL